MNLTKEEAIRRHRLMWNWIADETEKQKRCVTKLEAFEHFQWPRVCARCWCCEYDNQRDGWGAYCSNCPIQWPINNTCGTPCCAPAAPYQQWRKAWIEDDFVVAAWCAREIANLPERENV